jgi:hypothetical protein
MNPVKVLDCLGTLMSRLASVQKEVAELSRDIAATIEELFPRTVVSSVGPQVNPSEEQMRIWKEWADKNAVSPPADIKAKVEEQMRKQNGQGSHQDRILDEIRQANETERRRIEQSQRMSPPDMDVRMQHIRYVAGVLGSNGISLGIQNEAAPVPVFVLPEHQVSNDCYQLFVDIFGPGNFQLHGSQDPNARMSDLRNYRPARREEKVSGTIVFKPVPENYGLSEVPSPNATHDTPPPTVFNGSTGLSSPTAKTGGERIPNQQEQ